MMNTNQKREWRRKKAENPEYRANHARYMREWRVLNPTSYKACYQRYFESHRLQTRDKQLEYRQRIRNTVLNFYGRKCACCGETQPKFLSLDHVNGGGSSHRKSVGDNTTSVYVWVIKHNFPATFQILCFNCNMAKGFYGVCPHVSSPPSVPSQNSS